jgi:cell division protein FtsB
LHSVASVRQPTTDPLLMGVEDPAQHELAAGRDDLNVHDGTLLREWRRIQAEKWRDGRQLNALSRTVAALELTWYGRMRVLECGTMNVDLGIWDRLSRLIILLLIVAAVLGVALWYLPLIQKNETMRKKILVLESQIEKEVERNRKLSAEIQGYRDPRTVERLARERLNFARPDEMVIRFEQPTSTNSPLSSR